MNVWKLFRKLFGPKQVKHVRSLRICKRCLLPIKRNHRWTAQLLDDHRPVHWNCAEPTSRVLALNRNVGGSEALEQDRDVAHFEPRPDSKLAPVSSDTFVSFGTFDDGAEYFKGTLR
jgi:hypothetical protein